MSNRTTRKDAQNAFERFIDSIGGRVATSYNDVGAYRLDYAACYGGYNIERIINNDGGVTQPFGSSRKSPAELVSALRFACDAIRVLNSKN